MAEQSDALLVPHAQTAISNLALRRITVRTLIYVLLAVILVIQLFPLLWALLTSLMTSQETTTVPATLVPAKPNLDSYVQAIQGDLGSYYRNSIIASVVATIITMVLSVLAGYAFASKRRCYFQYCYSRYSHRWHRSFRFTKYYRSYTSLER